MGDITILDNVKPMRQPHVARVYYFEGNIFQPLVLDGSEVSRVNRAIREFIRDNAEMIRRDRAAPGYKTLTQLAAEQLLIERNRHTPR